MLYDRGRCVLLLDNLNKFQIKFLRVSFKEREAIISGDPLMYAVISLESPSCVRTLIRCNADENVNCFMIDISVLDCNKSVKSIVGYFSSHYASFGSGMFWCM